MSIVHTIPILQPDTSPSERPPCTRSPTVRYVRDIIVQPLLLACLLVPVLASADTSLTACAPLSDATAPTMTTLVVEHCPDPAPVFGGVPLTPDETRLALSVRTGEPSPGAPQTLPCTVQVIALDPTQRLEPWQKRVIIPVEIGMERLP